MSDVWTIQSVRKKSENPICILKNVHNMYIDRI